jgi:hypothetical protein
LDPSPGSVCQSAPLPRALDRARVRLDSLALVVIVLAGVFHLGTLRPGHTWSDDFALYVRHAQNLATGVPYADTGYIYNPAYPSLGPRTYPPLYPLVITPVVRHFGVDLEVLKAVNVITFLSALFAIYGLFRTTAPPRVSLPVLVLVAFSPAFWTFKDQVGSDFLFVLLVYVCLGAFSEPASGSGSGQGESPPHGHRFSRRVAWQIVLCTVLCFLAYLTRSVGVVLVPAIVGHELLRHRRFTPLSVGVPLLLGVLVIVQRQVWGLDASYADQLLLTPRVIADNVYHYLRALSGLWISGYHPAFRVACFAAASAAAAAGYVKQLTDRRRGPSELFVPLYAAVILAWPSYQGMRFLLPIVPLYFAYAAHGTLWAASTWRRARTASFAGEQVSRLAPGALLALGLMSYAGAYSRVNFGPISQGPTAPESLALYRFITTSTPATSVFVFRRPRALALFTGRSASVYAMAANDADTWAYLDKIRARYIAAGRVFPEDQTYLYPFIRRNHARLRWVYHSETFDVFCIVGPDHPCG